MAIKAQARVGDKGVGVCHHPDHGIAAGPGVPFTTTFTDGASKSLVNQKIPCVVGTMGTTSCGHQTQATTGSGSFKYEGKAAHRVGDTGIVVGGYGTYTVTEGSPDCFVGD